jgi:hypothetical protein
MTHRESLVTALAAALTRNMDLQPAHVLDNRRWCKQMAQAAVLLADDVLAAMAGKPALKLAQPDPDEPLIDLSANHDDRGNR